MICFDQEIDFVQGLNLLVQEQHNDDYDHSFRPLAFVLGTRQTDPNSYGQGSWEPSSPSSYMPPFLRVNPLLHTGWTYGHVWQFLHNNKNELGDLPICDLYRHGYTLVWVPFMIHNQIQPC